MVLITLDVVESTINNSVRIFNISKVVFLTS